mmetsp:Transcript_37065/g.37731  ORF Transcript_37065/g.37731 Transcript_37065/m.37731 type:complete len:95 (-) Transcript_37065:449-733(-)
MNSNPTNQKSSSSTKAGLSVCGFRKEVDTDSCVDVASPRPTVTPLRSVAPSAVLLLAELLLHSGVFSMSFCSVSVAVSKEGNMVGKLILLGKSA